VDEEVSWAVRHHQTLRYFPNESVGYSYPEAYVCYFGEDYQPPHYIRQVYDQPKEGLGFDNSPVAYVACNDLAA
jgi:hypothetical protein